MSNMKDATALGITGFEVNAEIKRKIDMTSTRDLYPIQYCSRFRDFYIK